jgi:Domain of unknown function (DUF6265)
MRMRWMAALLAPALLGTAAMRADARDAGGPLAELGFLTGCWRGAVSDSVVIEETWTAADADVMLATTRYLRNGRVVGWEFSRIHADSAGIHLTPYPDGEARPAFHLRPAGQGMAVFGNEANDFPQNIIYRGDGRTGLLVRLDGGGQAQEWRMQPGG